MNKNSPIIRASFVVGSAALLMASLSACSMARTDVSTMVYKVTVDDPSAIARTEISFAHTTDPEKNATPVMVSGDASDADGGTWSDIGAIVGKETATLVAKPPAGVAATCMILRDGSDELAKVSGEAGQPVTCEVVTPPRKPGVLKDLGLG